jgi:16S rRNA processing protein RimM
MTGPTGPIAAQPKAGLQNSGSTEPEFLYLAIGRIVRAHGIRGELSVTVLTDYPERFEQTERVYIGSEHEADPYQVTGYRWHKANVLLSVAGVEDRNAAERLVGQFVQIPREEAMELPAGSYYLFQLIGLDVITEAGERLGVVREIIETGANDVYVVRDDAERDILLPAIPQVVLNVDLEQGQMLVHLLDGLV